MMSRRLSLVVFVASVALAIPALAQNNFGDQPPVGYPPQNGPGGYQQQMPPQGYPQQMPPQGYPQQMPPTGYQQQMPPAGYNPGFPQQQAGGFQGQPPMMGQPQGNRMQPDFSRVAALEAQDFSVAPTASLHNGQMHGPTPSTIPGGLVISTEALYMTLQKNPRGIAIFDVLGGPEIVAGAQAAVPAGTPGTFNDQTQQEFGRYLQQVTGGNKQMPLAFYCQGPQCWMSYNAALRAINMGFQKVLWYRGGIEAWKMAGLPTQTVGQAPSR